MSLFETAFDLVNFTDMLRRRKHGVIEVRDGELHRIDLRPWPAMVSQWRLWRDARRRIGNGLDTDHEDVCRLYYDQVWRMPQFMALKYVVSQPGTSFRTFRVATLVLDEIARIKRTDAIVCEARNSRISDRLLKRWGWESHVVGSRRRHFVKRFYGLYPPTSMTPENVSMSEMFGKTTANPIDCLEAVASAGDNKRDNKRDYQQVLQAQLSQLQELEQMRHCELFDEPAADETQPISKPVPSAS